jgi:hypothetical protein
MREVARILLHATARHNRKPPGEPALARAAEKMVLDH